VFRRNAFSPKALIGLAVPHRFETAATETAERHVIQRFAGDDVAADENVSGLPRVLLAPQNGVTRIREDRLTARLRRK
jgi:hypothetical protein